MCLLEYRLHKECAILPASGVACGGARHAAELVSSHRACLGIQVWSTAQVEGVHRFLARSYRLVTGSNVAEAEPSNDQLRSLHIAIKRVCLKCPLTPCESLCVIHPALPVPDPILVFSFLTLTPLSRRLVL